MIYPFSVLDTRTSEWKKRKEFWITRYGIQSELGREDTKSTSGFWETTDYTSVFDPVLTENLCTWFCPPKGKILDPFAGGSVRGIVATELGFEYTGIDISEKQILANKSQSNKPNWIVGDSRKVVSSLDNEYDFVLTCPPYHDLEVYTDDPKDLSNMPYQRFLIALESIIYRSQLKLKDNRFFSIVVSEIRQSGSTRDYKIGKYRNFVSSVIDMCETHNLHFYNDLVLFNSQHQASRTGKTYFNRNRKIPSVHQNVLVFVKGNPDLATEIIDWDGTYKCEVDGVKYRSYREASISINPNELGASEVKRRCDSRKSKYEMWQTIGEETKPNIKYIVDGVPFEDIPSISKKTGLSDSEVYNKITSNNPIYKHWKRAEDSVLYKTLSYDGMRYAQDSSDIKIEEYTISCEGIPFYSTHDAGVHFKLSKERIRQKLKDPKFTDYIYLT